MDITPKRINTINKGFDLPVRKIVPIFDADRYPVSEYVQLENINEK